MGCSNNSNGAHGAPNRTPPHRPEASLAIAVLVAKDDKLLDGVQGVRGGVGRCGGGPVARLSPRTLVLLLVVVVFLVVVVLVVVVVVVLIPSSNIPLAAFVACTLVSALAPARAETQRWSSIQRQNVSDRTAEGADSQEQECHDKSTRSRGAVAQETPPLVVP